MNKSKKYTHLEVWVDVIMS